MLILQEDSRCNMVLSFPPTEFGNDPQANKHEAQTAERLGYDAPLVYDHGLGAHQNRKSFIP